MNIAIIGCGRIFNKHHNAIKRNSKINLIGICDIDKDRLSSIDIDNNLKFQKIENILTIRNLDLVTIATPSGMHPKHSIMFLKNGFNILIEKPLGTSIKDVKSIFKNNPHRKKIYIVKQNRFNPTIIKLKKLLVNNFFGKIHFVQSNIFWSRDNNYYDSDSWRGTKKLDGGALLNQASHYVDLIFWLFGKPKFSNSIRSRQRAQIETEDTFSSNLILENGIHCNLNVTTSTPHSNLEGSITIISEKASIKISGTALNQVEYVISGEKKFNDLRNLNYKIDNIYGYGHENIYKEIYKDLILNKKNDSVPALDGIPSLEWILKQYKGKIY